MNNVRAKVVVTDVTQNKDATGRVFSEQVFLRAVYADTPENKVWAQYTPTLQMNIGIDNPACFGFYVKGAEYYLDSSPVIPVPGDPAQVLAEVVGKDYLVTINPDGTAVPRPPGMGHIAQPLPVPEPTAPLVASTPSDTVTPVDPAAVPLGTSAAEHVPTFTAAESAGVAITDPGAIATIETTDPAPLTPAITPATTDSAPLPPAVAPTTSNPLSPNVS